MASAPNSDNKRPWKSGGPSICYQKDQLTFVGIQRHRLPRKRNVNWKIPYIGASSELLYIKGVRAGEEGPHLSRGPSLPNGAD